MNASSTTTHYDEIHSLVLEKQPKIICISETHLTDEIMDSEINIEGYTNLRVNSVSRHTGGVQLYYKHCLDVKDVVSVAESRNHWLLKVKVVISDRNLIIVVVYRSPSSSCCDFLDFFEEWCVRNICDCREVVVVVGDFNIDLLTDSTYSRRLKDFVSDYGLTQVIDEITRPKQNDSNDIATLEQGTLIDYVITNNDTLKYSVLDSPRIGDHYIISIKIGKLKINTESTFLETRGKNLNYNLMKEKLDEVSWNFNIRDINLKFVNFYENVMKVFNEVAPKKTIKICPRFKPWWNQRVKDSVNSRDIKYKEYKQDRKDDSKYLLYKRERNNVVKVIREEKTRYYEQEIDGCKNNSVQMWATLKSILPKAEQQSAFKVVELDNNLVITDQNEIPDGLNDFFIESLKRIVDSIDVNVPRIDSLDNESVVSVSEGESVDTFSGFRLLDRVSFKKLVFSLANKSSPDELSIEVIKNIYDAIEDPLINLVNFSLEKGILPSALKVTTIIPIPKKTRSNKASDLRPVNMLVAVEKIIEKCIYDQVLEFVEQNNILVQQQSGFRKEHSCETAIQLVIDQWKNNKDKGLFTLAVFLDLKRAFETIDRHRLLLKLKRMGLRGTVLEWFNSYLENRLQHVKVNRLQSSNQETEYGVPQGSILGPLLFILYINDMVEVLENPDILHLFADDGLCTVSGRDIDAVVTGVNLILENIHTYTCNNQLKLNNEKCKFMVIGTEKQHAEFLEKRRGIEIGGRNIEQVVKIKYLGVIVDRKLEFKDHANYVISKLSFAIRYLFRCAPNLSLWARIVVYNTIVLPHLTYCSTILFLLNQNETERLQKQQNRAMRIILNCSRYSSIRSMCQCLQWLPLKNYFEFNVLVFIFKIKIGKAPLYLRNKLAYNEQMHTYNTRQHNNFYVEKRNTASAQKSVFHKGLILFNQLPAEIKLAPSVDVFKSRLRQYMLQKCDINI